MPRWRIIGSFDTKAFPFLNRLFNAIYLHYLDQVLDSNAFRDTSSNPGNFVDKDQKAHDWESERLASGSFFLDCRVLEHAPPQCMQHDASFTGRGAAVLKPR
jgi:hypothetical protein